MIIRKLTESDRDALWELVSVVESTLVRSDFWLPIEEVSREHFLDDSWTEFHGAFEGDRLIGASALFYDIFEFGENLDVLGIGPESVAEVGRSMVHPDHRGRNILLSINESLVPVARDRGLTMLLATVHPENVPSQASFRRLGFERKATYMTCYGMTRDILTYDL